MIATIAIVAAMAAELDASNATINKKATAWRWASAEKRREDDNCRAQRASTRRKSRSQRRRDKAHANTTTITATSGKHGREQKWLASNSASTDDAKGVARIFATMTTTAVIATIAIATAREGTRRLHRRLTRRTRRAWRSRQSAKRRTRHKFWRMRQTPMAMTARRISPKRRDAVASKKETSRDRSNGHARRASKEEATSVAPLRARGARQTSSRAMTMLTLMTSTTMTSLPSWASVQWGTMALTAPLAFN